MTPEALRDTDPRQVGPYTLLGRLGQGGMGIVYLGRAADGTKVAVKLIHARMDADPGFRRRFAREVAAARRVARFCTAPVLDADVRGDPPYLVTEFVEGPSLDQAVSASGPLRGSALDGLAAATATALRAIHGAGVVHRDLKPSNVLLSQVGPKVIDFGIAHVEGGELSSAIVGTPAYMSPEQVSGGPIGPASDIFSWGCVLAFAAGGHSPFEGGSVPDILMRIVTAEPDLSGLAPPLRDLAAAALAKDAAARPTADDLLTSLSAAGTPLPYSGTASPPEPPTATSPQQAADGPLEPPGGRTVPPPANRRLLIGAAAAVLAVAAAATAVALTRDGVTAAKVKSTATTTTEPATARAGGNPLRAEQVTLFAPPEPGASWQAGRWDKDRPQDAALMRKVAAVPYGIWLTDPDVRAKVAATIEQAAGRVPVFVADHLPGADCLPRGAKDRAGYEQWIEALGRQIGDAKAVVILEPDSLAKVPGTKDCTMPGTEQERLQTLAKAVDMLKRHPNTAVYLDAAVKDWPDVPTMTRRLLGAGIARADGFSLNVNGFNRTDALVAHGRQLATCLALANQTCTGTVDPGRLPHFVVDTSRNGQGGWKPPSTYTDPQTWCNPPGRGIGAPPTTKTGDELVDAYLWINRAGTSNGHCRRGTTGDKDPERGVVAPPAGTWWGDLALERAKLADPPLR
ncbi:glycoside hydrolase family 6 protein [Nonomuraea sediminis]|uniref:glycoside hydrolase family 6 protein n=1 Tax=Nonomuraea sediminis TaxID=2835864 RepID=UPI001BDD2830|nr:glycoside hydrolase family 6 protein [Nonomuraea sediminis]